MRAFSLCVALLVLIFAGCRRAVPGPNGLQIATTTSYLEAAARDVLGEDLAVVRLAKPGACPGHFDIRPSQVAELRQCHTLLRFDFQKSLDAKLAGNGANGPRVAEIVLRGGMCHPDSYLTACRQIADHMVSNNLLARTNADMRLRAITVRLETLSSDVTNRVARAGMLGKPIIASGHQRHFCEWLGLKPVATFRAADTSSISEIEAAIGAGRLAQVKLVIANLPEGRRTADALAERLEARVVVFENFPGLYKGHFSFDAMLKANVEVLLRTISP